MNKLEELEKIKNNIESIDTELVDLKNEILENLETMIEKEKNDEEELNEFRLEAGMRYDEYLYATEKRSMSYGELAYIQDLNEEELNEFYDEVLEELEKIESECE